MALQMLLSWVERVPPHTVAIEVEPSEAMTSELTRTVYGKSSSGGKTARRAFSARVPTKVKQQKISSLMNFRLMKSKYNCLGLLRDISCLLQSYTDRHRSAVNLFR